jgi:DNA/RNA-binding domain of Phe-tRNA-synthetase-like protein
MNNQLEITNLLAGKLRAGVNFFRGLGDGEINLINEFVSRQVAAIRSAHAQALPPGFSWSRQLYRSFHLDPTKHRPSSEALWRRLRDKNDFPLVNPLVDLTNLLSLKSGICFGLYDLGRVHGPAVITLGAATDQYQGIRKEMLNFSGKIVLRDENGAFGNPSSDSLRASVNETSHDIMQVLFFHPDDHLKETILAEAQAIFRNYISMASTQSYLI